MIIGTRTCTCVFARARDHCARTHTHNCTLITIVDHYRQTVARTIHTAHTHTHTHTRTYIHIRCKQDELTAYREANKGSKKGGKKKKGKGKKKK